MPVKGKLRQPKAPMPKQHQDKPGIESKLTPRPKYSAPNYRPAGKLKNKIALITGGDSGIGRAVAVMFAREGARIAFTYLPEEQSDADETCKAIQKHGGTCFAIPADLSHSDACADVVRQCIKRFKRIDILVNNAAYQQHQVDIADLQDAQIEHTFRLNIMAYMYMVRSSLPFMQPGSCIINTGSITGFIGSKHLLDYSSTKGAIHTFTKSLAQNIIEKGIRVNCVAPGPVWTPLNPSDKEAKDIPKFGADSPMRRPAQPEEIAPAFVFLASEADSSYINGEVISILGGETIA